MTEGDSQSVYWTEPCLGFVLRNRTSGKPFGAYKIAIFTDKDNIATTHGIRWRTELPTNTGYDSSISLAKSWVLDCLTYHNSGQSAPPTTTSNAYVASRLLELTDSCARAVSASGIREPYATLSY